MPFQGYGQYLYECVASRPCLRPISSTWPYPIAPRQVSQKVVLADAKKLLDDLFEFDKDCALASGRGVCPEWGERVGDVFGALPRCIPRNCITTTIRDTCEGSC